MKKVTGILLLGLYLILNTGLVMNSHYCAGKLASVSLFKQPDSGCGKCNDQLSKNTCCKDTQTKLSIDEDQLAYQYHFSTADCSALIAIVPDFSFEPLPSYSLKNTQKSPFYVFETGPPKTPIYIRIQALLI